MNGNCVIVFVYFIRVEGGTGKHELYDYESQVIYDSTEVVVEENQFRMVHDLSCLD